MKSMNEAEKRSIWASLRGCDLASHTDDDVGVASIGVSVGKVDALRHPHLEKPQQMLHGSSTATASEDRKTKNKKRRVNGGGPSRLVYLSIG